MVEWGYGIGRSEVTALVQSYCKAQKRKIHFVMEYLGTTGGVVLNVIQIELHRLYKYTEQKRQLLKK